MEELKKALGSAISKDSGDDMGWGTTISSTFEKAKASFKSSVSSNPPPPPPPPPPTQTHPPLLITRTPGRVVSLWTCSKLCAIFFVAGVFVGYTLKRRVRNWAAKLLRRIKND